MLTLDYSSRQDPAYLKSQGVAGVMRYLSYSPGKNIDRGEADALLAAGLTIGLVWETYADRALSGFAGGREDAQAAFSQAQAIGQPSSRPIYFAVDWDASDAECAVIADYLRGAAIILGTIRVGVYGSYRVVKHCLEAGAARWGWQTYAWSWDYSTDPPTRLVYSGTHLYQKENGAWGGSVDFNEAKQADYGQWPISGSVTSNRQPYGEEKDMLETPLALSRKQNHPNGYEQWRGNVLYDGTLEKAWVLVAVSQYDDADPLEGDVHLINKKGDSIWHEHFVLQDQDDFETILLPDNWYGRVAVDYFIAGVGDRPVKRSIAK